jgi:GH18 family chitinase
MNLPAILPKLRSAFYAKNKHNKMGKYKLSIAKSAEKELSGIPQNMAAKIMDKLEGLSTNPYPF